MNTQTLKSEPLSVFILSAALIATSGTSEAGTQVSLSPSNIIGSSGSWDLNYGAAKILDQQTSVLAEGTPITYWLNKDNTGSLPIYITIDLGASYSISDFQLFNTHNASWFDRGTGSFQIKASNFVTDTGGANFVLAGQPVTLVQSTLAPALTGTPTAQTFASADAGSYRYLSFIPQSVVALNSPFSATAYGLNEIKVFATPVPEPAAALLLLVGLLSIWSITKYRQAINFITSATCWRQLN